MTNELKIKPAKKSLKSYFKAHLILYLLLLPTLIYLLIFSYYPMAGLVIAFKDWTIKGGIWGSPWASVDGKLMLVKHFDTLFSDPVFFAKLANTLRISSMRLLIGFPIPIIITILLSEMKSIKFSKTFQIFSYLPYFISWVVISGILISMTQTGSSFQQLLAKIFGHEIYFFTDNNKFLGTVIVSDIWKNAGWSTIIYIAAIAGIPKEQYEAAEIDGANRLQKIWHVTLPGMLPAISITLILNLSGLIYGGFDQIYNMYNEIVYDKGDILETYLFRIGIEDGQYDLGTALGLFNSLISLSLILMANKIIKKIGGEGIW